MKRLLVVLLVAATYSAVLASVSPRNSAQPPAKAHEAQALESEKRSLLWQSFRRVCPPEFREIDVYAENPSLTVICFRSRGQTLIYKANSGKVEKVMHAKMISPNINRITFEPGKETGWFALWRNDSVEVRIGTSA